MKYTLVVFIILTLPACVEFLEASDEEPKSASAIVLKELNRSFTTRRAIDEALVISGSNKKYIFNPQQTLACVRERAKNNSKYNYIVWKMDSIARKHNIYSELRSENWKASWVDCAVE